MKQIKKTWLRAIAGLAVVLGLALSVNAFENKAEVKSVQSPIPVKAYFKLDSNSETDISLENNWQDTPLKPCNGTMYLCEITYDASVYQTLQDFLDDYPTQELIEENALSVSHRN